MTARLVSDLMTTGVATLDADEWISIAETIMKLGRIRHMPVVDKTGRLVGIVTERDLFRGALARLLGLDETQRAAMRALPVSQVMTTRLFTTTPDTPLRDAAHLMAERKIGCLPVLSQGKLVGILTEGDFVACFAQALDPASDLHGLPP